MKIFILLLPFCSLAVLIPHKLIFISWHFKILLFSFPFPTEKHMLAHGSWFLPVQRELLHPCDCKGCLAQGPPEAFWWVLVACCTMTWLLFWSLWPGLLSPFLLCSKMVLQPWHYGHLDQISVCCRGCPEPCMMFSSIPGPCPPDASSTPLPHSLCPVSPDITTCSLGAKLYLIENHYFKGTLRSLTWLRREKEYWEGWRSK